MSPTQHELEFARLLSLHDHVQPATFILDGEVCTIGRQRNCQIVVARNVVSRLHARIEREGHRYLLRDADSANGTYVNEHAIAAPHLLHNGDLIGLGAPAPLLRFIDPDPTAESRVRLRYDERSMRFSLGQRTVELTPIQFRLLRHLHAHAGEVCTREACAAAIWGEQYAPGMDSQALDNVVASLRRQLRQVDPEADLVETRRGLGYVLVS
jgi:DNA-binding response OmpR family regulator